MHDPFPPVKGDKRTIHLTIAQKKKLLKAMQGGQTAGLTEENIIYQI